MSIFGLKKSVAERFMYGTVVAYVTIRSLSTLAQSLFVVASSFVTFLRRSISALTGYTSTLP